MYTVDTKICKRVNVKYTGSNNILNWPEKRFFGFYEYIGASKDENDKSHKPMPIYMKIGMHDGKIQFLVNCPNNNWRGMVTVT